MSPNQNLLCPARAHPTFAETRCACLFWQRHGRAPDCVWTLRCCRFSSLRPTENSWIRSMVVASRTVLGGQAFHFFLPLFYSFLGILSLGFDQLFLFSSNFSQFLPHVGPSKRPWVRHWSVPDRFQDIFLHANNSF